MASADGDGQIDGADFFARQTMFTELYDLLFQSDSIAGDIGFYDAFCREHGCARIVDAACGAGRISRSLAAVDRDLQAFDISPFFIARFKADLAANPGAGPIRVEEASFEGFRSASEFDLVIVSYYGLNYVLDRDARERSVANLVGHLARGGHMILHLPDPDLLTREVPAAELAALSFSRTLAQADHDGRQVDIVLAQTVDGIDYDPVRHITEIRMRLSLSRETEVLRTDRQSMILAPIEEPDVSRMADIFGLDITAVRHGFIDRVRSERIYTLRKR